MFKQKKMFVIKKKRRKNLYFIYFSLDYDKKKEEEEENLEWVYFNIYTKFSFLYYLNKSIDYFLN